MVSNLFHGGLVCQFQFTLNSTFSTKLGKMFNWVTTTTNTSFLMPDSPRSDRQYAKKAASQHLLAVDGLSARVV